MKKMWTVIAIFLALAVSNFIGDCFAATTGKNKCPPNLWKGIIGEAVGEGYRGMYAVTCAYRNRLDKNLPLGCVALKRKDIDQFVEKQGEKYQKMAKEIVRKIFEENGPDITKGATHYENVESFGLPKWAEKMEVTVKIKHHTFFKEKTS